MLWLLALLVLSNAVSYNPINSAKLVKKRVKAISLRCSFFDVWAFITYKGGSIRQPKV